MANVHFILQGKGGVGKSCVASILIQYLVAKGLAVSCLDTDPVNNTLGGYKEFAATVFDIMDGDNVDARKFDTIIEMIFNTQQDAHVVIDNGASSFIPLMSYLKENDAISLLQSEGHQVYLHTVITGGQAMLDTLNGLKSLCTNFQNSKIVVWLNLYFGEIADQDKCFEDFAVYKNHKDQFHAVINIPNRNKGTFGKDVEELLVRKESFEAGINSSRPLMVRQRLKTYRDELYASIEQSGLLPDVA